MVEYPIGNTGFRWHISPRLEYGWVHGRPDGWQGRVFGMGRYRWQRSALMIEGRLRYEWFWDFDGRQGHHQRFRPALFADYRLSRRWHVQIQLEPMYWWRHLRYTRGSVNQWRFFVWGVWEGRLSWRMGPAVFFQIQPRQPLTVLTIETQTRIRKPTARSTSPPDQTPHSLDPQP